MQKNYVDILSSVPELVALTILDFLDVDDLIKCEKCCKRWKTLARENLIWKRKCRQYNFREIQENERNENYVKFCSRVSPHWKGVFKYHHSLRKNWLEKTIYVNVNHSCWPKKVFYFHHIDDNILVMQVSDYSIRIFNFFTGRLVKILRGHTYCVNEIKLRENILVSSSIDSTLKTWNIDQEICLHSQRLEYGSVKFALSDDRIASTIINDRIIQVWRPETGEALYQIDNQDSISCLVIHDRSILTGCVKGVVRTFSLNDGTLKTHFQIHSGQINQITVKGFQTVSVFKNYCLKIWNTDDGSLLYTDYPKNNIPPINLDDNRIAWANSKSSIKIWDIRKGETVRTVEYNEVIVAITANEDFLFCVDDKSRVAMWDLNSGELKRVIVVYPFRRVLSVRFFTATRTKMALHTLGYTGNRAYPTTEKFVCDFDVKQ